MKRNGFITVPREITDWRWYKKPKTAFLYIHLLLYANFENHDFENITLCRGQLVTSLDNLSYETGLTKKEVRTAIEHLKETSDIIVDTSRGYSIITIPEYEKYASSATIRHEKGTQKAYQGHQFKKNKKVKKRKMTSYNLEEVNKLDTLDFID